MLFERQRTLLALVDALGGNIGNLDFQKLLFLYCQEVEQTPSYEFVPYHFGGFSFTSYADKRRLIELGLLEAEERSWHLTPKGRTAADLSSQIRIQIGRFARDKASSRGDSLIADVYRKYPFYAIRSEMAHSVLRDDPDVLKVIEKARPKTKLGGLVTIGYEGRTLENYLNSLIRDSITLLCDVRRNPLSRKYGFSKNTLSKACEGIGIKYEHIPELGIASEERQDLNTQTDYDALFKVYERDSLPENKPSLNTILHWLQKGERVALTCFESLPNQCHRHCVAEAVERMGKGKVYLDHL
jgi:uncharacterized protein (DUF488 family)